MAMASAVSVAESEFSKWAAGEQSQWLRDSDDTMVHEHCRGDDS